jgi:hypothetical protein
MRKRNGLFFYAFSFVPALKRCLRHSFRARPGGAVNLSIDKMSGPTKYLVHFRPKYAIIIPIRVEVNDFVVYIGLYVARNSPKTSDLGFLL